ncbi:benenodin family lasso peptide [Luteimonas sp. BDR2-5]|uniref:benenodin family lasso peptide n=1 Tax=Proluteimonas luteida TaxID=2878685 RepID=UPI001E30104C|nr:benenodin family lasso peptide [Luteimonas sp. BDR2-5]MCD9026780.1 benenodin family lasso peptide [Luteimonas sp. BDR2-5]
MRTTSEKSGRIEASEEVIVLGAASIETRGDAGLGEFPGPGEVQLPGISEE